MATILIVDDVAAHRSPLVVLLGHQGHRVIEAVDGRKALEAVGLVRPDLIITDVLMPVMDGYELVRLLRQNPATRQIPVLFYTAPYSEREAREVGLLNGLGHVLTKPADPDRVLQIVASILANEGPAPIDPVAGSDLHQLRLSGDSAVEGASDLRIANARLRAVINVGLQLSAERGSDALLRNVCAAARDLFGATYVTLGIVDPVGLTLQRVHSCGIASGSACPVDWLVPGETVPGICGTAVSARRALRGDNTGGAPLPLGLPVSHPEIEAYLVAPLASDARVYGWICLAGNEGRGFTHQDEELLLALARQVGHMYELQHEMAERQRVEAALRHERDRAQRYLDTASVILLAVDMSGRITLINRYGVELLGWPAAELLGADFTEKCVPERCQQEIRDLIESTLESGIGNVHTNPVVTKTGEEREIEWHNTLLRNADGDVVGSFSSGIDITKRYRALESLRLAEARTEFALAAAGVGIWDLDIDTGAVIWSPECERQHGIPEGTFGGTTEAYLETVHPEDRERVRLIVRDAFASGDPYTLEYRVTWADGSTHWIEGAARIQQNPGGKPVRGLGISLDVTERHVLEEQSQQTQKMEAVGQLAGGVAHDFNNLLTAILGYCELLLDGMAPGDVRRVDLGQIQSAGNSAADLTRQLLAFSRQEVIEQTVFDLNVVIAELRPMLVRLIGEHLAVVVNPSRGPAVIRADRGQVQQIVMNLAVNARDAMPSGGTLTLEVSNANPKLVTFTVSDTGTGMTPAVQKRLFEPFFTTKEPGKGTGIGLATVLGIVTQSGGTISVDSVPGRGTIFTLQFPAVNVSELRAAPAAMGQAALPAAAQTILLVEDANGLRALARRLLERQGYTVLSAANAPEAMAIFERHPAIDVLLTDVVMPGGSGPQLARDLCAKRPALKVIYMSGYAEDISMRRDVFAGEVAFLRKPFSSAMLGQKIRDVLDSVPAA